MANRRSRLYRCYATIIPPASLACNDSAEDWAGAKARSCFKVRKSSRRARSGRHGLSFPDRGRAIFPGCAARAALRALLEKAPTEGWIIGSNKVAQQAWAAMSHSEASPRLPVRDRRRHMIKWALQKAIDKFERDWKYDASYMRDIIDAS